MSVKGISISNLYAPEITQGAQSRFQQIQNVSQQLGQDLTAGNLPQARQDFAALMQNIPGQQQTHAADGNSPIAQALNALNNDLQAGDLTTARQDFATLQQDVQQVQNQLYGSGNQSAQSSIFKQNSSYAQPFLQLGQLLQSRYLTPAHQAYATLQQALQNYLPGSGASNNAAPPASGTINVIA